MVLKVRFPPLPLVVMVAFKERPFAHLCMSNLHSPTGSTAFRNKISLCSS